MTTTYKQTIEYTIDIAPIIRDLVAYRSGIKDSRDGDARTITGITDKSNIPQLEKGISPNVSDWIYVTAKFLDEVKTWGYGGKDWKYEHHGAEVYKDEYDCAINGKGYLIRDDMSSHMIFDHNDEALPVGIMFDYVSGMMRDGVYHLDKALEILKDREDIHIIQEIESVPYYNSYPGSRECIAFIWRPSVEDYRKAWKHCLESEKKYPSVYMKQAVFDLDLLGLRAGGAAKSNSFYGPSCEE